MNSKRVSISVPDDLMPAIEAYQKKHSLTFAKAVIALVYEATKGHGVALASTQLKHGGKRSGAGRKAEDNSKLLEADHRAQQWMGKYNELLESGKTEAAEKAYAKTQYWLDRLNKLSGLS